MVFQKRKSKQKRAKNKNKRKIYLPYKEKYMKRTKKYITNIDEDKKVINK